MEGACAGGWGNGWVSSCMPETWIDAPSTGALPLAPKSFADDARSCVCCGRRTPSHDRGTNPRQPPGIYTATSTCRQLRVRWLWLGMD